MNKSMQDYYDTASYICPLQDFPLFLFNQWYKPLGKSENETKTRFPFQKEKFNFRKRKGENMLNLMSSEDMIICDMIFGNSLQGTKKKKCLWF